MNTFDYDAVIAAQAQGRAIGLTAAALLILIVVVGTVIMRHRVTVR